MERGCSISFTSRAGKRNGMDPNRCVLSFASACGLWLGAQSAYRHTEYTHNNREQLSLMILLFQVRRFRFFFMMTMMKHLLEDNTRRDEEKEIQKHPRTC